MATTKIKAPTEEQIKQQRVRALLQQRASIAQGVIFNAIQVEGMEKDPATIARYAVKVADEFMTAIYADSKQEE